MSVGDWIKFDTRGAWHHQATVDRTSCGVWLAGSGLAECTTRQPPKLICCSKCMDAQLGTFAKIMGRFRRRGRPGRRL